ncbi:MULTISPECIES: deoxyguanosinetriphosphate triphosphohydrolase [Neisseria]|uniref:deoxyguanosinetriphosphate triphosphohydrolase n=1 Tax=Neisseria TaxID=482 RepID=UPI001071BCB9|nr:MULTISPECIES: deoxyguanosinetriphosphate triphosphohydrolase [Neisseria]MBF0804069.1 deoxyguanosinetriphosphate triphosphohydrolase [Neisseria sp. 19428wB4_WF04]QNT59308.1 dGTPase family protein [Neisseria musculi]TFU43217.1 deoxyguanosinetriphosphate triphosphohydrolase [Neisseria sp. WF04]
MNWQQLLSTRRFRLKDGEIVPTVTPSTQEGADALRTDFHIDYDRVVFSGAFRRLGRKTQVHPFAEHDHTHNRLTHSVEVASVGRSLGNRVGVMMQAGGFLPQGNTPGDIGAVVQVACLAHDLGNPPFGHTGEDALRDWFRNPAHNHYLEPLSEAQRNDVQTYEGNAHSLRILANLEMYRGKGGMRLTAAAIGTLLKYPWTTLEPAGRKKFNIYQTELPFIRRVAEELGLIGQGGDRWARHPLSYLMEAADDICYALLDLEDAVEIGLLGDAEVESILAELTFTETAGAWQAQSSLQRCAMLRGMAIGRAIEDVAQTFMTHQHDLLSNQFQGRDLLALCSPEVQNTLEKAKELARTRIFRHQSKLMTEIAAFPCLGLILDLLVPAAYALVTQRQVSARQSLALELLKNSDPVTRNDSLYEAYMKILDFVGGMTDNAAAKMAREVSGIGMV